MYSPMGRSQPDCAIASTQLPYHLKKKADLQSRLSKEGEGSAFGAGQLLPECGYAHISAFRLVRAQQGRAMLCVPAPAVKKRMRSAIAILSFFCLALGFLLFARLFNLIPAQSAIAIGIYPHETGNGLG